MKKFLFFSIVAIALTNFTQIVKAENKAGGGIAFGTGIEAIAIEAQGIFEFDAPVRFAPDIKLFLSSHSMLSINANAQYFVHNKDDFNIFLVGGLNLVNVKVGTFLGLNLGVGSEFKVQSFYLVPEVKFVISNIDQLVLGVTAMFPF